MANNKHLTAAKHSKQDEFYTKWVDIEKEINAYVDYNTDVFRGKTILLPCDDPEWSNFTKFFTLHFQDYGIKKLISTSYAPESNGKIFILDNTCENNNSHIDIENITWEYLQGDGNFRSDEIKALRDEADIVITNPPFSLFREFMAWLLEGKVKFLVMGNMNAIVYKEIFPQFKANKLWYGATIHSGGTEFRVPDSCALNATESRVDTDGNKYVTLGIIRWFTNIQHGKTPKPLQLMTMGENLQSNKRIINNPNSYKTYDNYDAIEVPVVSGIPSDYKGIMGVPISFLDKYNPEQFEILGSSSSSKSQELLDAYTGSVAPAEKDAKTLIGGKETYKRIFIKHKKSE